jgi:hypothetical protein
VVASFALAVLLVMMVGGCSSSSPIESRYDFNSSVDFSGVRSYAFLSDHPMIVGQTQGALSPMLENRIMESIRITMNGKGFNEVEDPESADVAIGFTVGSREEIKVTSYPSSYHAGYARRGYYYGYGMGTQTQVRQYTEGQLAVDVFEVASHTPAFHGSATKRISNSDRENQQETLNAITTEALSGFPLAGGNL